MPVQTHLRSDPVSHYVDVLESFARDHGLRVHNVPRDGNCLFTSVAYQIQSVGNDVNESSLRQLVVDYLSGHGDVYSPFCLSQYQVMMGTMLKMSPLMRKMLTLSLSQTRSTTRVALATDPEVFEMIETRCLG